jgi:hypothetical protein
MYRRVCIAAMTAIAASLVWIILFALNRASHERPATVESYDPWIDRVKRGSMICEVRGQGSLVPARNRSKLVARVKVLGLMANEVQLNQSTEIDTRKALVKGHVIYISSLPSSGSRSVDIAVDSPLPEGIGANHQVDATIQLGELEHVLYVGRPVHANQNSSIPVFRLVDGGEQAVRVIVRFGRSSVNTIEVLDGLNEVDEIILSDMSAWDNVNQIRLK